MLENFTLIKTKIPASILYILYRYKPLRKQEIRKKMPLIIKMLTLVRLIFLFLQDDSDYFIMKVRYICT